MSVDLMAEASITSYQTIALVNPWTETSMNLTIQFRCLGDISTWGWVQIDRDANGTSAHIGGCSLDTQF
ncbi:hypothetical protein MUP77_25230 [Candidatus Bathyarchaeota archaeon]|nr:hypothetical protein [Candidatus Bathyarchaeota archaeon]